MTHKIMQVVRGPAEASANRDGYLSPKQASIFFGRKGGSIDSLMSKYGYSKQGYELGSSIYRVWSTAEVQLVKTDMDKKLAIVAIESGEEGSIIGQINRWGLLVSSQGKKIESLELRISKLELSNA